MPQENYRGYVVIRNGIVIAWYRYLQQAKKYAKSRNATAYPTPTNITLHIGDSVILTTEEDGSTQLARVSKTEESSDA